MAFTGYQAELLLEAAFGDLFDYVLEMEKTGVPESEAPVFTYLLTQKQLDSINRICTAQGWPQITCPGILIDVEAIRHPLATRRAKDQITDEEIKRIITKAYSARSGVYVNQSQNQNHHQQALVLNTQQKVQVGGTTFYGMAILEIKSDGSRNYLAPVTCYHATEAKARAISKR